jgi:hypothetical protein
MDAHAWIPCTERLPEDGQRVLGWLPSKTGATEERNSVILRFAHDFFVKNPSKTGKATGPHFWIGEGTSNHFFEEVTHWMELPEAPPA